MKNLLFLLFIVQISYAQKLVEKEVLSKNSSLMETNKLTNVFKSDTTFYYSYLIAEKPNYKINIPDTQYQITTSNNIQFKLSKNEILLNIKNNKLYTVSGNNDRENIYSVYDLNKGDLIPRKKITLSIYSNFNFLQNGNLVFTEGGCSGYEWLRVYDENLNIKQEFQPFEKLSDIYSNTNNNHTFCAAQVHKSKDIRIALYNSYTYGGIATKLIKSDENYHIANVKIFDNDKLAILLYNAKKPIYQIMILDISLNIINKIQLKNPILNNKLTTIKNQLFFITKEGISSYDGVSGELNFKIDDKIDYTKSSGNSENYVHKELFNFDDNSIIVLKAQSNGSNEVAFNDISLSVLDIKTKNYLQEIKIEEIFKGFVKFKRIDKHQFILFSNNKMFLYEK